MNLDKLEADPPSLLSWFSNLQTILDVYQYHCMNVAFNFSLFKLIFCARVLLTTNYTVKMKTLLSSCLWTKNLVSQEWWNGFVTVIQGYIFLRIQSITTVVQGSRCLEMRSNCLNL